MPGAELVTKHYTHGNLTEAIKSALNKAGKDLDDLTIDDLAPVDEFHVGGRVASAHFFDQLRMAHQHQVLDVGCGLGGSARFAASHYGCAVTGVDLTAESVATGNTLCQWVGLEDKVSLQVGDATALTLADASFDRIYMMHVGMNVADKHALIASLSHLLRPGGRLGIYDIMRTGDATQTFPVPWASIAQGSEVAPIATYQQAVKAAGLVLLAEQNRREFALKFFEKLKARASSNGGPPPLGLHIVMGERHAEKIRNLMSDISRSIVAPVELIARKGD